MALFMSTKKWNVADLICLTMAILNSYHCGCELKMSTSAGYAQWLVLGSSCYLKYRLRQFDYSSHHLTGIKVRNLASVFDPLQLSTLKRKYEI